MKSNIQATLLLASFIWALVAIQGCETTHVVHIHNGKPVEDESSQGNVQAASTSTDELLPVDITMIIDRSGSMGSLTEQVIASYNEFIEDQQEVEGDASISLIQFDDKYEPNYTGMDIQKATELTTKSYVPRGSTALFDAIGRAITEAKDRITPGESDVVFVITTDGLENASTDYSGDVIKDLIADCESEYGWHFMYLASSDEAFNQHKDIGFQRSSCNQIEGTPEGWRDAQQGVSNQLMLYRTDINRSSELLEFEDEDEAVEEDDDAKDDADMDDGC
ncbi:MAG: VWA domain-containing protein [Planctomycetes bacterium]|nr:VWA domain-containing protein [Planctomycetota bacterium]